MVLMYCTVIFYRFVLYCIILLYCIVLYHIVLYDIVLLYCYIVLYCFIQFYFTLEKFVSVFVYNYFSFIFLRFLLLYHRQIRTVFPVLYSYSILSRCFPLFLPFRCSSSVSLYSFRSCLFPPPLWPSEVAVVNSESVWRWDRKPLKAATPQTTPSRCYGDQPARDSVTGVSICEYPRPGNTVLRCLLPLEHWCGISRTSPNRVTDIFFPINDPRRLRQQRDLILSSTVFSMWGFRVNCAAISVLLLYRESNSLSMLLCFGWA